LINISYKILIAGSSISGINQDLKSSFDLGAMVDEYQSLKKKLKNTVNNSSKMYILIKHSLNSLVR